MQAESTQVISGSLLRAELVIVTSIFWIGLVVPVVTVNFLELNEIFENFSFKSEKFVPFYSFIYVLFWLMIAYFQCKMKK